MTRKFLIVTALVAGVAATAEAQICAGTAPFTAGNMRLGVGAEFPDGAKAFGGELAYGLDNGLYVGGGVARWSADDVDASALGLAANGGYEMRFQSMPKVRVCPTAHLGYTSGPEILPDANLKTLSYGLGAAVGGVLPASDNLAIVPSAHLRWTGYRMSVDGVDGSETDSGTDIRLAAGLVFNRVFTIAPTIAIPLGEEDAESTFGFVASWNFGRSGGVVQQGTKKGGKKR